MSKLYKIRMNCVGFNDYVVKATSKKEAKALVEQNYHQCNGTEFEFCEFLEPDTFEKQEMQNALDDNHGEVTQL